MTTLPNETKRVPAIEGLFAETPEGPRLLGSRCATCGTPYFPRSPLCHSADCDASKMEDAAFGPRGRLWTVAIQNYPPPPPARYDEPYRPYAIGLVDLPEGLRVMGRIDAEDPMAVPLDADVELVVAPLCHEADGSAVTTWMFRVLPRATARTP